MSWTSGSCASNVGDTLRSTDVIVGSRYQPFLAYCFQWVQDFCKDCGQLELVKVPCPLNQHREGCYANNGVG